MTKVDVFIGGPMGSSEEDGAGLRFKDHMPNMAEAITQIIQELKAEENFLLLNPIHESIGTIDRRIFSMIDRAELGIIDCSYGSPSAMYELTLMHALGKPVIPIAFNNPHADAPQARTLPFYLRGDYSVLLDEYSVAALKAALKPKFEQILKQPSTLFSGASNPISIFYGMPLVDVSATTGLATTYYLNFLDFQLRAKSKIFTQNPELKGIVVIRPESIYSVLDLRDKLAELGDETGHKLQMVSEKDGRLIADEEQVRERFILDRLGPYIVDIPAPLGSQRKSPRLTKMNEDKVHADKDEKAEIEIRSAKLQAAMIEKFFDVIFSLSLTSEVPDRLKSATLDQLRDMLKRP